MQQFGSTYFFDEGDLIEFRYKGKVIDAVVVGRASRTGKRIAVKEIEGSQRSFKVHPNALKPCSNKFLAKTLKPEKKADLITKGKQLVAAKQERRDNRADFRHGFRQGMRSHGGIDAILKTMGLGGLGPQPVQDGGEKQLSENRDEVVARMLERLKAEEAKGNKAYRQDYSNGEFVSDSIIIGRTFAAVASRKLDYECAGDEAYFDPALQIYWRRGGSFD